MDISPCSLLHSSNGRQYTWYSIALINENILNTELNNLRKMIGLRKTYVSVGRISVYKVIENSMEHAMLHQHEIIPNVIVNGSDPVILATELLVVL